MSSRNDDGGRAPRWGIRPLSEDERALIGRLLGADFPGRDALVAQSAGCLARSLDSTGSLKLSPAQGPAAVVVRRVPVEAEIDDEDGVIVHILLHVLDGRLDELEIYRDDSQPLRRLIDPQRLRTLVL